MVHVKYMARCVHCPMSSQIAHDCLVITCGGLHAAEIVALSNLNAPLQVMRVGLPLQCS